MSVIETKVTKINGESDEKLLHELIQRTHKSESVKNEEVIFVVYVIFFSNKSS